MAGTAGLLCPECGEAAASESRMFRTRRKRGLIELGMLVAAGCATSRSRSRKPGSAGPSAYGSHHAAHRHVRILARAADLAQRSRRIPRRACSTGSRSMDLFDWQQSWLMWRAERKLKASADPLEITAILEQIGGLPRGFEFDPMRGDPELIRRTFDMLGSEDGKERAAAAIMFDYGIGGRMTPNRDAAWIALAKECAPRAAEGLADSNPSVTMCAAEVVSYAGAAADPYMQGIFQAIESDTSGQHRHTGRTSMCWRFFHAHATTHSKKIRRLQPVGRLPAPHGRRQAGQCRVPVSPGGDRRISSPC